MKYVFAIILALVGLGLCAPGAIYYVISISELLNVTGMKTLGGYEMVTIEGINYTFVGYQIHILFGLPLLIGLSLLYYGWKTAFK